MSSSPLDLASQAAQGFKLLECEACVQKIKKALAASGHGGKLVEIRGAGGRDFMVCLSHDGGQTTITQNGRHLGVLVGDIMFDNLHPNGIHFDLWLKDFDAIGGVVVFSVTDF